MARYKWWNIEFKFVRTWTSPTARLSHKDRGFDGKNSIVNERNSPSLYRIEECWVRVFYMLRKVYQGLHLSSSWGLSLKGMKEVVFCKSGHPRESERGKVTFLNNWGTKWHWLSASVANDWQWRKKGHWCGEIIMEYWAIDMTVKWQTRQMESSHSSCKLEWKTK